MLGLQEFEGGGWDIKINMGRRGHEKIYVGWGIGVP